MRIKKAIYRLIFSLRPTSRQEKFLNQLIGADRWVYNSMLAYRDFTYLCGEPSDTKECKALLPKLKQTEEYKWLSEIPSQVLQESVLNLDRAFKRFFKGLGGRPRFKKKSNGGSFQFPQPKLKPQGKHKTLLFLPIIKSWVTIDLHREIDGVVKGATVTKSVSGKWEISFVVHGQKETMRVSANSVGIDLGLKHFAVNSNGVKTEAPNFLRKSEKKLARLQRRLAKKVKGSSNYKKQRLKIAILHEHISNQRKNFIHNLSRRIVDNQIICLETLRVKNMIRNSRLSKSISDAGWGMFVAQLKYKSQWAGRSLRLIDQWSPSTKMCGRCGLINESLTLATREWACVCGAHHDRDVNAAKNILKIGMDTPEFKPVERLASGLLQKKQAKVGSAKQELKVSTADQKSA
jgi:putative transposase